MPAELFPAIKNHIARLSLPNSFVLIALLSDRSGHMQDRLLSRVPDPPIFDPRESPMVSNVRGRIEPVRAQVLLCGRVRGLDWLLLGIVRSYDLYVPSTVVLSKKITHIYMV